MNGTPEPGTQRQMPPVLKLSSEKQAKVAARKDSIMYTAGNISKPILFRKSGRKILSKLIPADDTTQRTRKPASMSLILIKSIVQVVALLLFIVLFFTQRSRFWLIILIAGFVSSLLFGHVYCGWICPVTTINGLIESLFRRLRIKKLAAPKRLQNRLAGRIIFRFSCAYLSFR